MKKLITLLIVVSSLFSCGNSEEKLAENMLEKAKKFYSTGNYDSVRITLHDLDTKFPRLVSYRRQADTLVWQATVAQIKEDMPEIDSSLFKLTKQAETLAKEFKFHKDEKFQINGDYEHRSMAIASNVGRNYIKPITDEKGKFRFISTLVGHNIKHKSVSASNNDTTVSTLKGSDVATNSYRDLGTNYETANFNLTNAKEFIEFLASSKAKDIKLTLDGEKSYSYTMRTKDLDIFKKTYELSLVLNQVDLLQIKKREFEKIYLDLIGRLPQQPQ